MSEDELSMVDEICRSAKEEGKVRGGDVFALFKRFDARLVKAMDIVRGSKVSLHVFRPSERKLWVVAGEHGEYFVLPYAKFCSCNDFYFQVAKGLPACVCCHLLAQRIAQLLGAYEREEHGDEEYLSFLERATPRDRRKEG